MSTHAQTTNAAPSYGQRNYCHQEITKRRTDMEPTLLPTQACGRTMPSPLTHRTSPASATDYMSHPKPLRLVFSVPPSEASALKERLRLLVVCRPQTPLPTVEGLDGFSATSNNPTEGATKWKYINVNLVGYALFDSGTGKVLANQGLSMQ
jgi:hypothetical protein